MFDGLSLPFTCTADWCPFPNWFARYMKLIEHPMLEIEDKFIWLWLASKCAYKSRAVCAYSYAELSKALNKPSELIHRYLFRLKLNGCLHSASIPVWYGPLTPAMEQTVHTITLVIPQNYSYQHQSDFKEKLMNHLNLSNPYKRVTPHINLVECKLKKPNKIKTFLITGKQLIKNTTQKMFKPKVTY